MSINKKVLFIFGCQRSGTTATLNYFKTLQGVKTFEEHSDIIHVKNDNYDGKFVLRLCDFGKLINIINSQKEDKIVIKPLVESQYAHHILENIPNSVGIWMYRNPKDVIASMLKKWGKIIGESFIDAIVKNEKGNWRNEKVNPKLTNFLISIKNECPFLTSQDKAAIFWYVRNTFYFSQRLNKNSNISKVSYHYLVNRKPYLPNKLRKLGFDINVNEIDTFNKKSIGKGKDIHLHPLINQLCFDLLNRLNETWD